MSTFTIDFPGTARQFTSKASSAITDKGGSFSGDIATGKFRIQTGMGAVEGEYQILSPGTDQQTPISITITKKPFIVSTNMIKSAINDFF